MVAKLQVGAGFKMTCSAERAFLGCWLAMFGFLDTHLGYKFTQGEGACISNVMGALRNLAKVEKTGWGKYPVFQM
jgi:hypothetical protein